MLDWFLATLFPSRGDWLDPNRTDPIWIDPASADGFGLVGIGGDLRPQRLVAAYRSGIFPMYEEGEPICWWSPDPRAVFDLDRLHISRRLARTLRSGRFHCTADQAFSDVMRGCADRPEGTWITVDMLNAYTTLHHLGIAHSVEVWREDDLVGGVYGIAIGGLFAGESMFYRENDASKIALVFLFERLRQRGYELFDTQIINDYTESLGAYVIPRAEYLERLQQAIRKPVAFG